MTASLKAHQAAAPDSVTQARLLMACRKLKEAGAWLQALPVSALGLRMEDEVFRVATSLRLGMPLCQPHTCQQCGTPVDCLGTHGLHCRNSVGRHPCHSVINDLVKRSLGSTKIAAHLEPAGICRSDGKRPNGLRSCPGGVRESWFGTPLVQIPLPHPISTWLPREQGQWLIRWKQGRGQNMRSWPPPIILSHWRWKPLVFSVRRRRCSFVSLAAASKMSQASPRPTNTCCREFQWLCSGGTRRQRSALPPQTVLI